MGTNADIARRWFREVWTDGGEHTVDELLAPDAIGWMEGGRVVQCCQDFKDGRRQLLDVFPDLAVSVEDVVEEDDKVVVRWQVQATHSGAGLGLEPTGRPVSFRGMTWMHVRGGQIVRAWDSWNLGGLMRDLGMPV